MVGGTAGGGAGGAVRGGAARPLGGRGRNKKRPPGEEIRAEADDEPAAAAALCQFCLALPSGAEGHAGLTQQVYKFPATYRSSLRLACAFCGTQWLRQRISAREFEWIRIAS